MPNNIQNSDTRQNSTANEPKPEQEILTLNAQQSEQEQTGVTVETEAREEPEQVGGGGKPPQKTNKGDFWTNLTKFGKAAWAYIKHAKVELIVLAAIFAVDLITKAIVDKTMALGDSITLIPDFLNVTYVHNTKAAFGGAFGLDKVVGDDALRIIFLVITVIAMGVFSYLLYRVRARHILMRVSLAMILAGAAGNFIDRLVYHHVRDFIEIVFFGCELPYIGTSFFIFNIADVGLTVGVIVFLIYFIVYYKDPKSPDKKPVKSTAATSMANAVDNTADGQTATAAATVANTTENAPEGQTATQSEESKPATEQPEAAQAEQPAATEQNAEENTRDEHADGGPDGEQTQNGK